MLYTKVQVPAWGEKISLDANNQLLVPLKPIIPFIVGDGIGIDISPVMQKVVDSAVTRAYGEVRKIAWMEIYAGEKSCAVYGENQWLPTESGD